MTEVIKRVKERLSEKNWTIESSDPLRITVRVPEGVTGHQLAQILRAQNIECEYSDEDYLVRAGDKISQLVVIPVLYEDIHFRDSLDENTERGNHAFGSSGR